MRKYMDEDITRTLIQAMVISKLDYANGLLYGINKKLLRKLQLVQNTAARLISEVTCRSHTSPISRHLHWLSIEARINFKVCFKCLQGSGPKYLTDLLIPYTPSRSLSHLQLVVPKCKSKFG